MAWLETAGPPERVQEPDLLVLLPERPADASRPAAAEPASPEPASPDPEKPEPEKPEPEKPEPEGISTVPEAPTADMVPAPEPAEPRPAEPASPEPAPEPPAPPEPSVPAGSAPAPRETGAERRDPPADLPTLPSATPPATPPTTGAERVELAGLDAGLVEDGAHGPLPRIGPDGTRPWQAYARPFARRPGRPAVAIVITDLGLSAARTRAAVETLPPVISLAFLSYAEDVAVWLQRARAAGHEVLLAVPMEPQSATDDPGPRALTGGASADALVDLLEWHLSRGSAYVGLTPHLGGRFLATESAVRSVLAPLRDRGLLIIEGPRGQDSTLMRVAREMSVPHLGADRVLDDVPSRAAIERRLQELERIADARGSAVAIGHPYPATLDALTDWAAGLAARGFDLAPVSALAGEAEPQPPGAGSGVRP
ncbi:MAG: divergent polysaccharide deacetylase family protein [Alphaproteobacteria bacterium]